MKTALVPAELEALVGLIDVRAVAQILACSPRTVYRLCDAGRMPKPTKIGAMVRWDRRAVLSWCAAGCPDVRQAKGGGR